MGHNFDGVLSITMIHPLAFLVEFMIWHLMYAKLIFIEYTASVTFDLGILSYYEHI